MGIRVGVGGVPDVFLFHGQGQLSGGAVSGIIVSVGSVSPGLSLVSGKSARAADPSAFGSEFHSDVCVAGADSEQGFEGLHAGPTVRGVVVRHRVSFADHAGLVADD